MSILRDFEKRLEGAVEGFFARAFRSGLQPVELAKAIQRYEADYQHVGIDAVYVPNVYRFALSPGDLERFAGFTRSLQRELADVARRTADEKGWRTQGPIRIEFERSESVRVGTFELRGKSETSDQGRAAAKAQPAQPASSPQPSPSPQPSASSQGGGAASGLPPLSSTLANPIGAQPVAAQPSAGRPLLRVVDGSDKGKVFELSQPTLVIGRLPECEITLTGAGVSRRHARVQQEGDRWTVTDLGSTNGIRLNAQQVQVTELKPGDRLEVGDVMFTFLMSER